MGDQVRAKNCDIPNKRLCPSQRTSGLPGTTNYQYLGELEASRPSAEKVRFDMLKRVNGRRDKIKMVKELKRFGAEFKVSGPVLGGLGELMGGREEKRAEVLGRGGGGEEEVIVVE
ncbi:hypothetical protein LTR17_014959 [Elasticomyces elasticus]|nr:hypothetical protein LTR17_014959 [Elasticomyces elasticus]